MAYFRKSDLFHLAFVGVALSLRGLPRSMRFRWSGSMARGLGTLWYRLNRADAELTRQNLKAILGVQLAEAELEATARAVFQNVALHKLLHDMVLHLSLPELNRLLRIEGAEHLKQALDQAQGVVLVGTHFGIPGYVPLSLFNLLGYPSMAVLGADPEPDHSWTYRKFVQPVRHHARRHLPVIDPIGLPQREMADCLRQNRILMILGDVLDEDTKRLPAPHVLGAPFLGHQIPLKTGPFRLARWLGSPVLPAFIVPRPGGFTMIIEPPLDLSADNSAGGLAADLAAFTARFEPHLLRHPALWMHWRHEELQQLLRPAAPVTPAPISGGAGEALIAVK